MGGTINQLGLRKKREEEEGVKWSITCYHLAKMTIRKREGKHLFIDEEIRKYQRRNGEKKRLAMYRKREDRYDCCTRMGIFGMERELYDYRELFSKQLGLQCRVPRESEVSGTKISRGNLINRIFPSINRTFVWFEWGWIQWRNWSSYWRGDGKGKRRRIGKHSRKGEGKWGQLRSKTRIRRLKWATFRKGRRSGGVLGYGRVRYLHGHEIVIPVGRSP